MTHRIRQITSEEDVAHLVELAVRDERVRQRKTAQQLRVLESAGKYLVSQTAQSKAGVYVGEAGKTIVGIGFVPFRSDNGLLYVQSSFRGQGIGTGLLHAVNNAREEVGEPLIHPDRVFGYVLPRTPEVVLTGGW